MKTNDPIESWLFDVRRAPLFAVYPGKDGKPMQIPVWRRDALIAADTGEVVGIVGNGYKLLTNQDALSLCRTFCRAAFPDTGDSDWIFSAAYGPRSRSRVSMDLYHRSISINFAGGASEAFTPFARIVNSFDTSRAVRLEVGFIRAICSNGMIFHEATNQITAAHTVEDIRALKEKRPFDGMKTLTRQFEDTLSDFRAVPVTPEEGMEITRRVMDWPILPDKPAARTIADGRSGGISGGQRVLGAAGGPVVLSSGLRPLGGHRQAPRRCHAGHRAIQP